MVQEQTTFAEQREAAREAYLDEEVGQLRAAIIEALRAGDSIQKLAERSWVGETTIRRLLEGVTKRPIGFTTSQLWKALGREFIPPVDAAIAGDAKIILRQMEVMTEEERRRLLQFAADMPDQ